MLVLVLLGTGHLAVAGQQMKYGVSVKEAKPAALAKAKTYVWTNSQPSFDKDVDRQIVAAVDRELAARGFTKLDAAPSDVVVTYASLSRTSTDLKSKPAANGMLREYAVGTLVVDMRDPANRQSFFVASGWTRRSTRIPRSSRRASTRPWPRCSRNTRNRKADRGESRAPCPASGSAFDRSLCALSLIPAALVAQTAATARPWVGKAGRD